MKKAQGRSGKRKRLTGSRKKVFFVQAKRDAKLKQKCFNTEQLLYFMREIANVFMNQPLIGLHEARMSWVDINIIFIRSYAISDFSNVSE